MRVRIPSSPAHADAAVAQVRGEPRRPPSGPAYRGPSGVGKSRLAREALARFRRLDAQTRWVQATRSAASVPLGDVRRPAARLGASADPLDLVRRSAQALRELGGAGEGSAGWLAGREAP
jgi:hypothetical protein